MQTPFDLLRKNPDGSFIWIEAAADLVHARARLRELASRAPGEYVLFDQASQETLEKFSSADLGCWNDGANSNRFAKPR